MTYAPRLNDATAPQEQLYQQLAASGFAPVQRRSGEQAEIPGLFIFQEMWRLDRPDVRAYIALDLQDQAQMVVQFQKRETLNWSARLKSVFKHQAAPLAVQKKLLSLTEVLSPAAALPFCEDVSPAHAAMGAFLGRGSPHFFIVPLESNKKKLMLQALIEPPLKPVSSGTVLHSAADTKTYLDRMGQGAARQLRESYRVQLRVLTGENILSVQALRSWPQPTESFPESLSFMDFMDHAGEIMQQHHNKCVIRRYPQVTLFIR